MTARGQMPAWLLRAAAGPSLKVAPGSDGTVELTVARGDTSLTAIIPAVTARQVADAIRDASGGRR